jgi:hypothetical protein
VSEEEKQELVEYCRRKKKFRTPSDLARYALWVYIGRNPSGSHRKKDTQITGHE